MKRIAIFASGSGTNAENIMRYFQDGSHGVEVALVVCNNPDAGVISRSRGLGVPVVVMSRKEINDPSIMSGVLVKHSVDLIVLAGVLLMLPAFLTTS